MTVKELIEKLSEYPLDREVTIENETGWEQDINEIGLFNGHVVIDMMPR